MTPSIPDRRRIFVSYHHELDQLWQLELAREFADTHEVVEDNSLGREIESTHADYVMRQIHEGSLTGSSGTVVQCGAETPGRKYVDWEVCASLNRTMGVVAVMLPTARRYPSGTAVVPERVQDNIDTAYSPYVQWDQIRGRPDVFRTLIEFSLQTSKARINNSRPTRRRNTPVGG